MHIRLYPGPQRFALFRANADLAAPDLARVSSKIYSSSEQFIENVGYTLPQNRRGWGCLEGDSSLWRLWTGQRQTLHKAVGVPNLYACFSLCVDELAASGT